MKSGEKILCSHCGERSVLKEKKIYDDSFALKEIKRVCALCGAEFKETAKRQEPNRGAAERLSALLGGETVKKVSLAPEADDGHFCLHCVHYLQHPFMTRCALTMKEIEATDSCGKFERKKD